VYRSRTLGTCSAEDHKTSPIEGRPWKRRAGESPDARSRCHKPHMNAPERQATWPGEMRHSTADQQSPMLSRLAAACLRSSTTARKGMTRGVPLLPTDPIPPRRYSPAPQRVPATGPAARPRRSHRRCHRRTAPSLYHRPRARRSSAHRLQDPPRLPVPALRRGLPSRHLPAHPRRADRRQRHS
jgi:hypothetical protein